MCIMKHHNIERLIHLGFRKRNFSDSVNQKHTTLVLTGSPHRANILHIAHNHFIHDPSNDGIFKGGMIHSESAALNVLRNGRYNKKSVSLFVMRTNSNGEGRDSKPCFKCTQDIADFHNTSGCRIKNVYYTTNSGDIEKRSVSELVNDSDKFVSSFYRRNCCHQHCLDEEEETEEDGESAKLWSESLHTG